MFNLQNFFVIGVSHEELSLEEREIFLKTKPQFIIESLFEENKIKSFINLSTCLRVEFYLEIEDKKTIELIREKFSVNNLYIKNGIDAVSYLFKLSCGFYSVIKGEDQILAQIKTAYADSLETKKSSKLLNIIFNKAIEIGKKFRSESCIAHNALSLEAISLKFIKSKYSDLSSKNIFILGIGDLSKSILSLLMKDKLKNVYVTNRTFHTAEVMKLEYEDINVVDYKSKYDGLANADVIISATSAPHFVVEYDKFKNTMKNKNYLFLDLAMPRDIDEKLKELKNISIFNLDDIWEVYHQNTSNRDKLLDEYSYLIEEQIGKLDKALSFYKN